MSFSPSICENSPEPGISDVCVNLETQFMEDLSKGEGMRVFARVRPMLSSEVEAGYKECIGTIDEQTIRAVVPSSSVKYKSSSHLSQDILEDFKFTSAYGPEVGQFVFFEESMMNTMQNFIEGQNSLVFSYGITGSGKTYTLQGDSNNPGIIPLSLHLFFASVENQLLDRIVVKPDKFADVLILNDNEVKQEHQLIEQLFCASNQEEWSVRNSSTKSLAMILCETFSDKFEGEGCQTTLEPEEMAQAQAAALMKELSMKSAEQQTGYCSVWVSFAEIYNETIFDLLQPNVNQRTKLTLGEDKNGNVYVKGLREVCVFNSHETLKLLSLGQKNLKIASTKLNYQSSRSHCIFTVKVIRIPDPENITHAKVNRLSFCDLAGSERAAKAQTTGLRLKEAGCINTSLLVLGRCLEQLRLNPSQRDKKLVPFRESKLTRLLSGFFTGKGKAVMITNASPSEFTFDETLHALRFSAVATELIINDSYIATASSTLQTITNIWTNTRANTSTISDKSISFSDSEVFQEKDELIEKLLDLAESLTNNLEKEKKEKVEMEIKIRQEVCQEYSEYSDELLERQKQNYEEEQEAIREIYKKRISSMEEMYKKIIEDYKSQTDESDSSCDEVDADSNAVQHKSDKRKSTIPKKSLKEKTKENIEAKENDLKNNLVTQAEEYLLDTEVLRKDMQMLSEELKRTKDELEKSKDYYLALETATEEMERKLEISNFNLEKALTENGELKIKIDYLQASFQDNTSFKKEVDDQLNSASDLETLKEQFEDVKLKLEDTLKVNENLKKELDAVKIDCVSYKTDNDDLFTKKSVLDGQLKLLSDELASTKSEKENLYQKLTESERNVANRDDEIKILLEKTNELTKLQEKSNEYEKSLEKAKKEAEEAEVVLKSVNQTLDNALMITEKQKQKIAAFETKCAHLTGEIADILKKNEDLIEKHVSVSKELELEKSKAKTASSRLEQTLQEIKELTKESDMLKSECLQYENKVFTLEETNVHLEEKLSSVLNKLELEKNKPNKDSDELEKTLQTVKGQADEIDALKSESINYKKEICTLKQTNLSIEEKLSCISKELESEVLASKKELDVVNNKLADALSALDKQKQEIKDLTNVISFDKNKIAELHKQNEELQENINSQAESEASTYKKELDIVNSKLGDALCALNKEKEEVENLTNVIDTDRNKIAELHKQNEELQESINSQAGSNITLKEELDTMSNKLEESLGTINKQKEELQSMMNESSSAGNKIVDLIKMNEELEKRISSQTFQTDILYELIQVLEKCELQASLKVDVVQSNIAKFEEENENLKTQLKNINDDYENECGILHKMVQILQKCELFASNKTKELHTFSINHVEQIMDLEKCVKQRDANFEGLKNDYNLLQKELKDLQATSKKQLQTEKQQYKSETENIKIEKAAIERENKTLKYQVTQLEAEIENMKTELEKLIESNNQECKEKNEIEPSEKKEEKIPEKKTSRKTKNQTEKRKNKSNEKSGIISEDKKSKTQIRVYEETDENSSNENIQKGEKRKNKSSEKSAVMSDYNSSKTKIYEEGDENSNNGNSQKVRSTGRRQLRCVENVPANQDLVNNKDLSSKTKGTKRKEQDELFKDKLHEKKTLKKIKLQNINETENISNINKPQNLRVKLLKANVPTHDIPLPSPRMTRGRKRLCDLHLKQKTGERSRNMRS